MQIHHKMNPLLSLAISLAKDWEHLEAQLKSALLTLPSLATQNTKSFLLR